MKIKYIGFDKDGTLFDSMPEYARVWGEIFNKEYGIDENSASKYLLDTAGQPNFLQVDGLLRKYNVVLSKEEVFKKSSEITKDLGERVIPKAFPEVKNVLVKLKASGFKIFISSGQQEIVIKNDLRRTGLSDYVDFIAGMRPDDPNFIKGEQHLRAAAKYFAVSFDEFIKETVFVGDTQTDLDMSLEAHIPCIMRKSASHVTMGALFTVDNFKNLEEIIRKI